MLKGTCECATHVNPSSATRYDPHWHVSSSNAALLNVHVASSQLSKIKGYLRPTWTKPSTDAGMHCLACAPFLLVLDMNALTKLHLPINALQSRLTQIYFLLPIFKLGK